MDTAVDCGNALLQSLHPEDAALIAADLQRHGVGGGGILLDPARPVDRVYFPETAVIGLRAATATGRMMEIGLVGREGMVGWSALLDNEMPGQYAVALLSIPTTRLRAACSASPTLLADLLRFMGQFVQQLSHTIVSTACDPAERRLARWLLMLHDRIDGDEIAIKHSELGMLLNLRRATITDCLHILEGERALRCTRGHIAIRDRAMLEAFARHNCAETSGGR
ncbi:MAG: Crp/Fnr family transcriptional regulator [Sphingomonas sp.]|nr:Crp/Fnr family transcriptional regulator [Sphingomonas sp.]